MDILYFIPEIVHVNYRFQISQTIVACVKIR
jgi:hypothetical protein